MHRSTQDADFGSKPVIVPFMPYPFESQNYLPMPNVRITGLFSENLDQRACFKIDSDGATPMAATRNWMDGWICPWTIFLAKLAQTKLAVKSWKFWNIPLLLLKSINTFLTSSLRVMTYRSISMDQMTIDSSAYCENVKHPSLTSQYHKNFCRHI
jgi:hypothetical protein